MLGEALFEEGREAHRLYGSLEAGSPEGIDILRRRSLALAFDQALLENDRVGRIDDGEPSEAWIAPHRSRPADCAAPIVTDQGEAFEADRVRQGEEIVDQ